MAIFNVSVENDLFLLQNPVDFHTEELDAYGNLSDADTYFDNRLRSIAWRRAIKTDKMSALREATFLIDRLNYAGSKLTPTQVHQFPRAGDAIPSQVVRNAGVMPILVPNPADATVPLDIQLACYEIALKLIMGVDPDKEIELLATTSHAFGGVKTGFDRSFMQDHLRAGIPSFKAWSLLQPYLRNPTEVIFTRI